MRYELTDPPERPGQWNQAEQLEDGVIREYIGVQEKSAQVQEQTETVIGDMEDLENWHMQAEELSCTVSIQELVGEQLLDRDLPEGEMIQHARKQGWYDPMEGASKADTGKVLEEMGFEVHRANDQTLQDLLEALAEDEKVICGVDTLAFQNAELAGMPGRKANHVVQLVAVDFSDVNNPQVILNDMGIPNGRGVRYSLDVFLKAWKAGRNYAVFVGKGDAV